MLSLVTPLILLGKKSENDNAQNIDYPKLDRRIRETYAAQSKATYVKTLYDSYIRAIRWATDRIKSSGVIGFVTGSGYVEKLAIDGLRKSLSEEFSNIYVLNLRGDIRKNMLSKGRAQEGQNVFGNGSMTGIAVTLFVKNPNATRPCKIYYHDIGDNLTTKEKLRELQRLGSVGGIKREHGWQMITPDAHGDWLNQRNSDFEKFLALGDKKGSDKKLFEKFSCGIVTSRDAWAYNSSRKALAGNMSDMISFYNSEVQRFNVAYGHSDRKVRANSVNDFVNTDAKKISWSRAIKQQLARGKISKFESDCIVQSLYRPFTRQWLYYNRIFNEMVYRMPRIFPIGEAVENRGIQITGTGARSGFSVLMTKSLPDYYAIDNGQCFPRYIYENAESLEGKDDSQSHLFANFAEEGKKSGLQRRDALTDEGLAYFKAAYPGEVITKDDVFYYVYGILHSEDYRVRYAHNLSKELPRIPTVKRVEDFWAFVTAGRELGYLHMNYEEVEPYSVTYKQGDPKTWMISDAESFYRVQAMKFAGKRGAVDKSTVVYNAHITMQNIPLEAYEYVVNGRSALEWVMERQVVKTDKASGLVNDANRYAVETVGNPAYPLELFQRVITVSLETMKIVRSLPKLDVRETEKVKLSIVR